MGASLGGGCSEWFRLPSPSAAAFQPNLQPFDSSIAIRNPVLQLVLPHLGSFIPISLACGILELYSTSSFTVYLHPISPDILGHMSRKESFLSQTSPRACSPDRLASISWVAPQISDHPFLTSPPATRGCFRQNMLELTVGFLQISIYGPSTGEPSSL